MRGLCTFLLLLSLSAWPASAFGQDVAGGESQLNLSHARYDATGTGLSLLASPQTLGFLQGGGGFTMHFSDEPFVVYSLNGDTLTREGGVVQSQFVLDLHGAIGFGFLDVGLVLPVSPVMVWGGDPTNGDFPVQENDLGGVGDLTIIPKVRLLDTTKKGIGFGIQLPISVPTGHSARYLGDGGVTFAVDLLAELRKGPVRGVFNFSPVHLRPRFEYGDFVRQVGMDWGAGAEVRISEMVGTRAEIWGTYSYMGSEQNRFTGEWSAALVLRPSEMVSLELGGGGGIAGFGVPKLRAFAGVRITSPERGDKDSDGILDSKDQCPQEAEDFDSWDDSDGCPEPDNDGDGIPDGDDACPDNAENPGIGDDQDGCPDVIEEPVLPEASEAAEPGTDADGEEPVEPAPEAESDDDGSDEDESGEDGESP